MRGSSDIQLLERMNMCSNQSKQLSACRTTGDNVENDGLTSGIRKSEMGMAIRL